MPMIHYEGNIFRPPSEAYSLLIQVTVGCTHNKCRFCSMYKDKRFHIRQLPEIFEDLRAARAMYRYVDRVFLCDGDALCLRIGLLLPILEQIHALFPECRAVNVYGRAKDVLRQGEDNLRLLHEAGVQIVYIGAESGSDTVLRAVDKGVDREQLIQAVRMLEASGIKSSVTLISGLGGQDMWEEHAVESAELISQAFPSYLGLLTLTLQARAPMLDDVRNGIFRLLTPKQVLQETALFLKELRLPDGGRQCVFRSNHVSNYLVLSGDLPNDRDRLLRQIDAALTRSESLRPEWMRGL